jgi:hypothetical protein
MNMEENSERRKELERKWKISAAGDNNKNLLIPKFILILRQNKDFSLVTKEDTTNFNTIFDQIRARNAKFFLGSTMATGSLYFWRFYGKDAGSNKLMRFFKFWGIVFLPSFFSIPIFNSLYNKDLEEKMTNIIIKYNMNEDKFIEAFCKEFERKDTKTA